MAPRRYGVAPDGSVQRLWNGKLVEDFTEADTLRFMADTDIQLHGKVSADILAAIKKAATATRAGRYCSGPERRK